MSRGSNSSAVFLHVNFRFKAQGRRNPPPLHHICVCIQVLFLLFLPFVNSCADNSSAAYKQQCDPQHEVACVAGLRRLRQLRRYGVGFFDLLGAVFVTVIPITAAAVPILDVALGILGGRLGGNMLQVGVILRVKLAVSLSADLANRFFDAGCCTSGMPVVDRHGHLGGVAGFVGDYDSLPAFRRSESKAVVFIECDLRFIDNNGIDILLVNGNGLCLAVDFAVLNPADDRLNIVKRYAVGAKVCYSRAVYPAYLCFFLPLQIPTPQ